MRRLKWIVIGHKVLVRLLTRTQRGNNVLGRKKYYILSVVEMSMLWFFLLQFKSRWKWPWRLKITTTRKSWRISHRHNTRQSRKTLPRRYDFFHLSIPSLPIPFFSPTLIPFCYLPKPLSFLFLLPLFFLLFSINSLFPPSFPSQPYLLSLSYLSLLFLLSPPALLSSFSSLPILLPPSFPLPTLHHFSRPLTLSSVLPPSLLFP